MRLKASAHVLKHVLTTRSVGRLVRSNGRALRLGIAEPTLRVAVVSTGRSMRLDETAANELADLYREHRPGLLRLLGRRAGTDHSEDVVQQAFARLAGREQGAEGLQSPFAYLARTSFNILSDESQNVARCGEVGRLIEGEAIEPSMDGVALVEARDQLRRIEVAVGKLKPITRQIFLARRLDGYSYKEIADQTGLSIRAVEKQMSRAIKQLARHLGTP